MKFLNSKVIGPYLTLSLLLTASSYAQQQALPSAKTVQSDSLCSQEQLADKICALLLSHSLEKDIDAEGSQIYLSSKPPKGLPDLKQKLLGFINHSQPIAFTLVGFPFKSGNREKNVIAPLPDLGERLALEKLQKLMKDISRIYSPGAHLTIYTDGLAFSDLLGIPIEDVVKYEHTLKQLALDLSMVSIVTCQDLFPGKKVVEIQRHIKEQNITFKPLTSSAEKTLSQRLLKELNYRKGKDVLKTTSLTLLAQEMDQRSQQINYIYKCKFPPSINLSVHYQKDLGKKVGIALSPSPITPWHGVAVLEKNGTFVIRRKEEVSKTAKLVSKEINKINCYYYLDN